jgi:hypothetical protein
MNTPVSDNQCRGYSFKQGPRNRLCRAAGAAAPPGGSALHEVKSVGAMS